MESLTLAEIKDFAVVALALMGFVILLGNVIKTFKEWRKPGMSEAEWRRDVDGKLDNDNKRIKALEDQSAFILKAVSLLLQDDLAILEHLRTDNASGRMAEQEAKVQDFLIKR